MVAMACPTPDDEPALLTFALLWYDLANRRLRDRTPDLRHLIPLQLFLPDLAGNLTAQRLRWLHPDKLCCRLFRFNQHGSAGEMTRAIWETWRPHCFRRIRLRDWRARLRQ